MWVNSLLILELKISSCVCTNDLCMYSCMPVCTTTVGDDLASCIVREENDMNNQPILVSVNLTWLHCKKLGDLIISGHLIRCYFFFKKKSLVRSMVNASMELSWSQELSWRGNACTFLREKKLVFLAQRKKIRCTFVWAEKRLTLTGPLSGCENWSPPARAGHPAHRIYRLSLGPLNVNTGLLGLWLPPKRLRGPI